MGKRLFIATVALLSMTSGVGIAAAQSQPSLEAHGPTEVSGTDATSVFKIGDRTVRQVRYQDRGTLVYTFALANDGRLPVTVTGLTPVIPSPTLFRYSSITDAEGNERFTIAAGERRTVRVSLQMVACERLSARAGSFATKANIKTSWAGVIDDVVTVEFPEEVHTGSPREVFCPNATATSRSPG